MGLRLVKKTSVIIVLQLFSTEGERVPPMEDPNFPTVSLVLSQQKQYAGEQLVTNAETKKM